MKSYLGIECKFGSEIFIPEANFTRKETTGEKPIELIVFVPPAAHLCMEAVIPF